MSNNKFMDASFQNDILGFMFDAPSRALTLPCLITNFRAEEKALYEAAIEASGFCDTLFIGEAKKPCLEGAIGLYTSKHCDLSAFWAVFNALKAQQKE